MRVPIRVLCLAAILAIAAGCSALRNPTAPAADPPSAPAAALALATSAGGSLNGHGGDTPAYYDHRLFTINFREFPKTAETTLLAKNPGINKIFQSDPGLPGGEPFISVIDAIPTDGMNPLWEEWQIAFTAGHTPRQLFPDDEIFAAQTAGEITLTDTDELYRCSVVGPKPK